MKSNRTYIIIVVILLFLIIISALIINNLMQTIEKLDTDNDSVVLLLEQKNEELNKRIEFLEQNPNYQDDMSEMYSVQILKLTTLVEELPQINKRMAFINESYMENGDIYLFLDYVEWLTGDDAIRAVKEDSGGDEDSLPNGYYIENKVNENVKVKIEKDSIIYVVDSSGFKYMGYNDFETYLDAPYSNLFWIYEIDNEIVLLLEQYRP